MHSLPLYQVHTRVTHLFTQDEHPLTHVNHAELIVHFRIHPFCYIFYGFGEMYNDTSVIPISGNTEYFHSPKNPLCSACSSLLTPTTTLAITDLSIVCIVPPFPGCYVAGIAQHVSLSDWAFFA